MRHLNITQLNRYGKCCHDMSTQGLYKERIASFLYNKDLTMTGMGDSTQTPHYNEDAV